MILKNQECAVSGISVRSSRDFDEGRRRQTEEKRRGNAGCDAENTAFRFRASFPHWRRFIPVIVLYPAETELRPVIGGTIQRLFDPETGTNLSIFQ